MFKLRSRAKITQPKHIIHYSLNDEFAAAVIKVFAKVLVPQKHSVQVVLIVTPCPPFLVPIPTDPSVVQGGEDPHTKHRVDCGVSKKKHHNLMTDKLPFHFQIFLVLARLTIEIKYCKHVLLQVFPMVFLL